MYPHCRNDEEEKKWGNAQHAYANDARMQLMSLTSVVTPQLGDDEFPFFFSLLSFVVYIITMSLLLFKGGSSGGVGNNCNPCSKKYVLLCAACGGLAVVLGSLFAVLYVVLRSYTSSLHYFETVPSYVASVSVGLRCCSSFCDVLFIVLCCSQLILTGLLMLCFGWRRNRFGYLVSPEKNSY